MNPPSESSGVSPSRENLTRLLQDWRSGDSRAEGEVFSVVYDDLRRLAAAYMRNERAGHTLPPTALVNEAFLRLEREFSGLTTAENRRHFFAIAARAMRRILVEHARHHAAARRPSPRDAVSFDDLDTPAGDESKMLEILAVDGALEKLRAVRERLAQVVELRYFAGFEESEVAELLGVSRTTVSRDWHLARILLKRYFEEDSAE